MSSLPRIAPPPLTIPRSRLIGRERELAAIREVILSGEAPLVTLTGPGGVGKTRLALQTAADLSQEFGDGVWFVDLTPLVATDLVLPTLAQTFHLSEVNRDQVLDQLVAFLAPRHLLLVLDNFEQLLAAGPQLSEVVSRCPRLTILVTSRVSLRLSGEQGISIEPLSHPYAVQLFVNRAHAVNVNFALTAANQASVNAVCARLDGLPLAVELAAARTNALPPSALLARLDRMMPLLTGGARDQPARHRTMREAIAWSYELLDPEQQRLFRTLSVFAGGFSIEAVEAVAGTDAPVLDGLAALVESCLIRLVDGPSADEPRYQLLETMRAFALELLEEQGEEPAARQRHAAYFCAVAEHAYHHLHSPAFNEILPRLRADLDNFRSALSWADRTGETGLGLALSGALVYFWIVQGMFREGHAAAERALSHGDGRASSTRARALLAAGWLARLQGQSEAPERTLIEAIEMAESVGDRAIAAIARQSLGFTLVERGNIDLAASHIETAWAELLELGSAIGASNWLITTALTNLAQISVIRGDIGRAQVLLDEARARQLAAGYTWGLSYILRNRGDLALERADYAAALASYREAMDFAERDGHPRFLAEAMVGMARLAVVAGDAERSALLLGAASAMRELAGTPRGWGTRHHLTGEAETRSLLDADQFERAWSTGTSLPLSGVLAEARAIEIMGSFPPVSGNFGLTGRELDVLERLCRGMSDREIGEELSISPRTVSGHVANILVKFSVDTRTAAATFAMRAGIV